MINENLITLKFDNCKEFHGSHIGTNVIIWVLIANSIFAFANRFGQTNYRLTIDFLFINCKFLQFFLFRFLNGLNLKNSLNFY